MAKSKDPGSGKGAVRLLLMRHAKAAYPDGISDHERPLAGRGRADAEVVGTWLVRHGWVPDAVVCSDAARTMETATLVIQGLGVGLTPRPVPDLYEAGIGTVIDVIKATPAGVRTLLVVGHEPVMSATSAALCGSYERFPTAAIARIEIRGGWKHVGPDSGKLLEVRTPD